MGFLDELTKRMSVPASGAPAGGGEGALLPALMGLLTGGGLQQLVSSFQQKGLGEVVGSWVSTGKNLPVSPDQIQRALGPEELGQLAQQTGLDVGSLASQLSSLLPNVVDKLTPDGKLPEGGVLQDRLGGLLKGLL
jgi:uncharacterized protein YidB (DUF937 family)